MKASELIERLNQLINEKGDLNLVAPIGVSEVNYHGAGVEEHRINVEEIAEGDVLYGRIYTGYSDVNSQEIFVGDIVKTDDSYVGVIKRDEEDEYYIEFNSEYKLDDLLDAYSNVSVIGNVIDNSELLMD